MRVIFIFESLHKLIKADRLLEMHGALVKVKPVPTNYSSVCGMCLEAQQEDTPKVEMVLTQSEINYIKHLL